MTKEDLFERLRLRFGVVLRRYHIEDDTVDVTCRALTPEEAIGSNTKRMDFPILTGKDVMIQAEYRGFKGQAFTDAPVAYHGRLKDVPAMDLCGDTGMRAGCFWRRSMPSWVLLVFASVLPIVEMMGRSCVRWIFAHIWLSSIRA